MDGEIRTITHRDGETQTILPKAQRIKTIILKDGENQILVVKGGETLTTLTMFLQTTTGETIFQLIIIPLKISRIIRPIYKKNQAQITRATLTEISQLMTTVCIHLWIKTKSIQYRIKIPQILCLWPQEPRYLDKQTFSHHNSKILMLSTF